MGVGRNRMRMIGMAASVVGVVLTVQACGAAASSAPAAVPSAAPAADSAALAASPEPSTPETPAAETPAAETPAAETPVAETPAAAATPTPKPAVSATSKPIVSKKSAQEIARSQPLVDGTPCTVAAKSCVDLDSQRAWLFDGKGKIVRGPVNVASGGKTEPTPPGYDLRVYLKDQDHVSNESFTNGVADAMPWSVFFATGGIAFHEGDPENPSGGCVHLSGDDARAWFAAMQVGDQVQVVHASEELPARGLKYSGPMYGAGGVRAYLKEHKDDDDD